MISQVNENLLLELKEAIEYFLSSNNLDWDSIQEIRIQEVYECPLAWHTLHAISQDKYIHIASISKALKYFCIPFVRKQGRLEEIT
jgi:hypothetical protein